MDASAVGWAGVLLGAFSLVGTIYSQFNARRSNRDKMEFELKTRELEIQGKAQGIRIEELERELVLTKTDLADCRDQHKESEEDRRKLWREREDDRRRIESLESQINGGEKL